MTGNNKIIIYDDTCPLCATYTNAFLQTGLIEKEGRKNFSTVAPELLAMLDIERSVNEIPLVDVNTKQVWYGIDALLEILGQKLPLVKKIGNIKPIKCLLYKCYKLISFNRRVIVATDKPVGNFDCTPDFNIRYRVLFMSIFLIFNTLMLFPLQQYLLSASLFEATSIQQLQWAHFTIVGLNILLAFRLHKKDGIEYLGQVNMLALTSVLLSVPLVLINKYSHFHNTAVNSFCLGIIALFIVIEYRRRMKFAQIIPRYPLIVLINFVSMASLLLYLILSPKIIV